MLFWAETPERAKVVGQSIVQGQQQEAQDKFRRFTWLLLIAALIIFIFGVLLTTTLGERVALVGIFLLAGISIFWRIQSGRL